MALYDKLVERDSLNMRLEEKHNRNVRAESERERVHLEAERQKEDVRGQRAEKEAREKAERLEKVRAEREKSRQEQEWSDAARQQEDQCRHRDLKWPINEWSFKRVLERFKVLADAFEKTKFSQAHPLTVGNVPWPVLHHPTLLQVTSLTWNDVEKFFKKAKGKLPDEEYHSLLERTHRMFHLDRWKSRRLATTVHNMALRQSLEKAVTLVCQAVAPLRKTS